jgi:5-methylcytosine-specific restriction endonuclease McrA
VGSDEENPSADGQRGHWGGSGGREKRDLSAREIEWYGDVRRRVIETWDSDGTIRYRVTDQRGQKVERACLICRQVRALRLSHVHPKWTGRPHQREGGFVRGYRDAFSKEVHLEQDYEKHYLLCEECEQYVSESERYVSLLSRGHTSDLQRIGAVRHSDNLVTGLRSDLLFRFFASFLLRSHGAASAPHIRLRFALENELRTSIVDNSYRPARHQLAIARVFTRAHGVNPRAHAIRSLNNRLPLMRFEGLLGGLYFIYLLRAPDGRDARWTDNGFRQMLEWGSVKETELRLHPVELFDLNILKIDLGKELGWDINAELAPFDSNAPCPCGLGNGSLGDCCGSTWLSEVVRRGTRP